MKEKVITVRVSEDEKKIINEKAGDCGLSPSQYIRMKIDIYNLGNKVNNTENDVTTPQAICNVLTEIQKIRQIYPEINLDGLEESVAALCRS